MRGIVRRLFIILVLCFLCHGYAMAADEYDEEDDYLSDENLLYEEESQDYLEPWNRLMFNFNDRLYFLILKPVTEGYVYISPVYVRVGVFNFFSNLSFPVRFVNSLLQGKGEAAERESARFIVNSTIGVLGFGNPAENDPNLKKSDEDFGQTLGSYGAGGGAYVVWPFLGPSTIRDTIGDCGDAFLNPTWYIKPRWVSTCIWSYDRINSLSFRMGDYETLKAAAFEPYIALKDGYLQLREKKIEE
ncbi:MAG: VacJ family lipoprotein [Deltaproteobacteria bacterium]|nr:VacJ family lipoprotein [Deltaproteobacteria bacterium]